MQHKLANNVPIETVRPLALWLIKRFGCKRAAVETGLPWGTLNNIAYRKAHVYVCIDKARKITDTVRALKPRLRSVQQFDQWELPFTREPTPTEQQLTQREWTRDEKAYYRRLAREREEAS